MSPAVMPCVATMTVFRPDPHTLLIVVAATWSDRPPPRAACRAGAWPTPADTTLPMRHSSTLAGSMPARRTASRMTIAPSWGAVNSFNAPEELPGRRANRRNNDHVLHVLDSNRSASLAASVASAVSRAARLLTVDRACVVSSGRQPHMDPGDARGDRGIMSVFGSISVRGLHHSRGHPVAAAGEAHERVPAEAARSGRDRRRN